VPQATAPPRTPNVWCFCTIYLIRLTYNLTFTSIIKARLPEKILLMVILHQSRSPDKYVHRRTAARPVRKTLRTVSYFLNARLLLIRGVLKWMRVWCECVWK